MTAPEPLTCPRARELHWPLRYCPDCPEGDQCQLPMKPPEGAPELNIVERCLEPLACQDDSITGDRALLVQTSIAVSLKRIADALEENRDHGAARIRSAITDGIDGALLGNGFYQAGQAFANGQRS